MENKQIKGETVKAFWNMLRKSNPPKGILIVAILLSIIETGSGLIVPLLTKDLVDQLASSSLELSIILLLTLAFVLQTVTSGFAYYLMTYIGEKVVSSIRERLWAHILKLPISFFDKHESGETMSRVTQDTNTVKTLITQHLITFVTGFISIVATIIILCIIDWKMTAIMLIAIPTSLLVFIPLGRKMFTISKLMQDEMASFSGNLGRVLSEIRLVKAYHAENIEMEKGKEGITHLFQFGLKEARIQAIISPFMTFIMMLILILLIGYGGVRVASGELSAGSLVAIIIYMFQIIIPFSSMATAFTAFQKAMGATERMKEILSIEVENPAIKPAVENPSQPIKFENVSFSYSKDLILKNISLFIPNGKTTAFVGPSGSGKTTLFSLLERFYLTDMGKILLGDKNIDTFDLQSWRSEIGYVSQESPIMSGSIMENITYGIQRTVSINEVEQAAQQANAMEFIARLPDGLKTEVGERGMKLSGGQRQRIAIARALIRNPKILLLDEATSNLDSSSEKLVQEALEHLMIGRTTLVIAHRLSTVIEADQIVVLEQGEITGCGTHQQLLQKHTLYKELAQQQLQTT
ncbi:ABC transporter ATP-binding protein [Metabacillus litoralis]|uniref:ABC transporter ATP-binding protein n=1 Tax=Metabacillus litoralis TaxID=152268 RepID=UPI001CFEEFA5|nr:ABC transporter ATP-binding protein [Metabacillus litoralis]